MSTKKIVEDGLPTTQPYFLPLKPFDPEKFLGVGWKVIEVLHPRTDSILDATKIITKVYLQPGERWITADEHLHRIKASAADCKPQLGAADGRALYEEEGRVTLRWLNKTKGIKSLSCWNTILQDPAGHRSVLCLDQDSDG
ncbi:MAG: hypothetical protein WC786_04775, partial [Patescibacteria group bacterium]